MAFSNAIQTNGRSSRLQWRELAWTLGVSCSSRVVL
jgi:hypothetical protein